MIFHVDLEHGGDDCGILQLSVTPYDPTEAKVIGEFDQYIKPPANAVWSDRASEVHGIYPSDGRILNALAIKEVWLQFVLFIEQYLDGGLKKGIIAAWGGQSCDCEWLFRITEDTHYGILFMPRWCPYFMDPKKVVSHYASCKLSQKHSGVIGYGCDEMWCYVTGNESLPGSHSAIVDAREQCTIVADKRFWDYIDKPMAMIAMLDVWASKKKNRDIRNAELKRKIPSGWTEGEIGSSWKLPRDKQYSFAGGGKHGPSLAAKTVCEGHSLVNLFLFFFPLQFLQTIARETNRYGNEDWVRPASRSSTNADDDDNSGNENDGEENDEEENDEPKSKHILISCLQSHANARHRFKGLTKPWKNVTPGFILVFFGIICILGATKIRNADFLYSSAYHTNNPMVQNACTHNAFLQIRRYIHFVDNARLLPKSDPRWHHLQKIQIAIDTILKTLAAGWILGKRICVDESMIKYMGRFVSFIQYMPAKPIKHGIKVYALCCAYTGYLYMFEVYTGKGSTPDGSPKGVISRLLYGAGATGTTGRILYTDNFYTSLRVMKFIYLSFSMLLVGTSLLQKRNHAPRTTFHLQS
jgi:hypothetical protein